MVSNRSSQTEGRSMPVDFPKYLGLWYEIARYPNSYENRNAAYATAEYRLVGEMIAIENRDYDRDGKQLSVFNTVASVSGPNTLSLGTFPPAEYKVEWVSTDYQYAIVGNSNKSSLWILSRGRVVWTQLRALLVRAGTLGYNTSLVINLPMIMDRQ